MITEDIIKKDLGLERLLAAVAVIQYDKQRTPVLTLNVNREAALSGRDVVAVHYDSIDHFAAVARNLPSALSPDILGPLKYNSLIKETTVRGPNGNIYAPIEVYADGRILLPSNNTDGGILLPSNK